MPWIQTSVLCSIRTEDATELRGFLIGYFLGHNGVLFQHSVFRRDGAHSIRVHGTGHALDQLSRSVSSNVQRSINSSLNYMRTSTVKLYVLCIGTNTVLPIQHSVKYYCWDDDCYYTDKT